MGNLSFGLILTWLQVKDLDCSEQAEKYERLHNRYAPVVERLCLSLRGFYLKSAQFVAIMDDFLYVAASYLSDEFFTVVALKIRFI